MRHAVYRDTWGVPHLWADSVDALAFAQGRTAALDRAWQIEVERWRSEGRTATHLGPSGLPWDRFARRARLDDTARRCFAHLDAPTRRWVTAYVAGVNDALEAGARVAPEYAAIGATPGAWQPWSPLGVFLVQHVLFSTFPHKLWRAHVAETLGPTAIELFDGERPGASGSNAWAVTGDRTAHGAPIIAGDPHRILELPGVYQQVRLACPEFDVLGLAFPGVPGVAHFGHAGDVAWAITNAMADYQDLYREELRRSGGRVLAREASGWAPAFTATERIDVRGHPPESVEVVETIRGPVILGGPDGGPALSLRTPSRVSCELGFSALLPLLRSSTVGDVARALARWVEPVNSVLVADTSGAVRRLVAGRVPRRHPQCRRLPVPAWDRRYDWRAGYEPLSSGTVTGLAVHANDRRRGEVAELGLRFAAPHRARRIRALLEDRRGLDVDDMAQVHTDTRSGSAPTVRALLTGLDVGGPAREVAARIATWDGHMRADSDGAAWLAAWRGALVGRLAAHDALRPLHDTAGHGELFAPWLSPTARIGHALESVIAGVGQQLGIDIGALAVAALHDVAAEVPPQPWGDRHRLAPVHVLADVTGVTAPEVAAVALSGDTDCVLATTSLPGVTDRCSRGPVARYVWDLHRREDSRWIVPFGASGRPGDPHFDDQLPRWAAGELVPAVTEWDDLTPETP